MPTPVVNYDGSITANPQQLVVAKTVADIQNVLRDTANLSQPRASHGQLPLAHALRVI